MIFTTEKGDRVYYNRPNSKKQNGIVKSICDGGKAAFVVYNCDNDWGNYSNYTGQRTEFNDLSPGWVDESGNIDKKYCDHEYILDTGKWMPINRMSCINCGHVIND